jgi:multidrug transporter EmrE-like cation transporter
MAYILLALAFVFNASANILLKIGSKGGIDLSSWNPVALLSHNWQFVLGLFLFAVNVVFYFLALRSLPISVAYPVMVVMSFIIINGYALTMLGETLTPLQILGYLAIVGGLILIVSNAS